MLRIFEDERRSLGPFSSNPIGTDQGFPLAASRMAYVGPATRRHPLLASEKPWSAVTAP